MSYKSPNVVNEIRKLEWPGHVIRKKDARIPETILKTNPEGRCGVGSPELRWLGGLEAGSKNSRYKNMETKSSR
jgi:hypothetical protein